MVDFKSLLGGAVRVGKPTAIDDGDFEKSYPLLFALMAHVVDEENKVRKGCSLTIVVEDGVVKAGLNERNYEVSLWTSATRLADVFCALEEAIGETPPRWRKKAWEGKRK